MRTDLPTVLHLQEPTLLRQHWWIIFRRRTPEEEPLDPLSRYKISALPSASASDPPPPPCLASSPLQRFYTPPSAMTQSPTRDSEDIDHGFSAYHNHAAAANAAAGNGNENGRHPSPPFSKPVKPSRPFANNEDRFTGKKDVTNAPPPGTYDKPLSWKAAGVLKIKDHTNKSLVRTKRDTPGPGDYSVGRDLLHKGRANPHFVMGGSNERFQGRVKDVMPGPGQYDPTPLLGSLIKPTYNAIMVDEISAHR
jgi:hypothetical protein